MAEPYENTQKKILSWAEEDRPREKLMQKGRAALSDAELIAILLGSGTTTLSAVDVGRLILAAANNNLNDLAKLTLKELQKVKGVGPAKAVAVVAALELGRRRKESEVQVKPKITSSQSVYDLMAADLLDLPHEEFWVLLLNRGNQVIGKSRVSTGGVSGTVADPKMIFQKALEVLASAIILVHNHPSGNLKPSQADIKLTKKLKDAGEFLDTPVLDHVIFAEKGYYSFADEGAL